MVGWLPKVHRAGHVCRAAVVLGARVEQQHGVSADGAVGAGDGAVVDDGAVGPRAGDGGEGLLDEPLLLPAHLDQLQPHLRLGDGAAGGHLSLQPGEELGHRRAVPQVRLPHPRQLSFVLQRLGQSQRGLAFEHPHRCRLSRRLHPSLLLAGLLGLGLGLCLNRLLCLLGRRLGRIHHRQRGLIGVHPHHPARSLERLGGIDPRRFQIVRPARHLGLRQVRCHLRRDLVLVGVERGLVHLHHSEGEGHRTVRNVPSPHVEQPRDLVQRGHHHRAAALLRHGLAEGGELVGHRDARELQGVHAEGGIWEGGAVRPPDGVHQVLLQGCQRHLLLL
mmetsp:Transcript_11540/g.24154  ORF Transcript_11540/g.24154 Transcript_11540/m.24154 type:complete len:333 (-) Transcript_11540:772-1770(-)